MINNQKTWEEISAALNALQAERDALAVTLSIYEKLMDKLVTTDGLICSISRWYYFERYAELSDVSPAQHLAAHDAEVAKAAIKYALGEYSILTNDEVDSLCERYATQLRAKGKP